MLCARMLSIFLIVSGCASIGDTPRLTSSPTKAARYLPPADQFVKSRLMDFDSPFDTSFVISNSAKVVDDPERSGNRVMSAPGAKIKLGSLIRGREFPGMWDLLGIRLRADREAAVVIELSASSGTTSSRAEVTVSPAWTMHWIELEQLPASMPAGSELQLGIKSRDGKPVLLDDVVLAQSRTVVAQSTVPISGESWQVDRSGVRWRVRAGEQVLYTLPAAPFVEDGYVILESNPVRTVFGSKEGTVSIDRHGRLIENGAGRYDPVVAKFAKAAAENASPATLEVDEDEGRVERNLPGDRNNDGYDETRGCYTVRTSAARLSVRLSPGEVPVSWPVIEVLGLPSGAISVWLEGQLVPYVTRLSDGKAIIELPIRLERAVEVQIRVK